MEKAKTYCEFLSSFPDDHVEDEAGDGMVVPAGRNILHALRLRLLLLDVEATKPAQHAYFGWTIEFTLGKVTLRLLLQYTAPWLLIVEPRASWFTRRFTKELALRRGLSLIAEAMAQDRHIFQQRWMTKDGYWKSNALARERALRAVEGFRTNIGWMAVSATDRDAVADALGLENRTILSWHDGLAQAHAGENPVAGGYRYAVFPPVEGWVLVAGVGFVLDGVKNEPLERAGKTFGRVLFFWNIEMAGCGGWSFFEDGVRVRFVHQLGSEFYEQGAPCPGEAAILAAHVDVPGSAASMFVIDEIAAALCVSPFSLGRFLDADRAELLVGSLPGRMT